MRISDWSSDVCSSDLQVAGAIGAGGGRTSLVDDAGAGAGVGWRQFLDLLGAGNGSGAKHGRQQHAANGIHLVESFALKGYCGNVGKASWSRCAGSVIVASRSEEHTSELQSLMRISYAVFCLKKK